MKIHHDIIQGSDEWKRIRKGKPTASEFSRIITPAKGQLSSAAGEYIDELIEQCYFPDLEAWSGNYWTDWGKQFEPEAREALAAETGLDIAEVGFVVADDGICGCSPDGLVFNPAGQIHTGAEIKCLRPKTHVGNVLRGVLPPDYKVQVHGSMAVCGADSWHFWEYVRGWKPLHIVVLRDEFTMKVERALETFVAMYRDAMVIADKRLRIPAELMEEAA